MSAKINATTLISRNISITLPQHRFTSLSTSVQWYQPAISDSFSPTFVFLPFWGGSASTFEPVQVELAKTHPFQISIAISYPGTGLLAPQGPLCHVSSSESNSIESHDIPALAAVVLALLESSELNDERNLIPSRKIVLCAHSMSAKVVWEVVHTLMVAKRNTGTTDNRIVTTGLLLLAPAPPGPLELPAEMRAQQLGAYESFESAKWTLENVLTHKRLNEDMLAKLARDCASMSPGAKKGWIELGMRRDCLDLVKELASTARERGKGFPIKALVGDKDRVETVERVQKETVEVLEGLGFTVDLKVVQGAGHLLPVEVPDEVAMELVKLL